MRNQLSQLRKDLDDAVAQLNQADPNDAGTIALAFGPRPAMSLGAFGNRTQVLGDLAIDPQLRAAINQTQECQNVTKTNPTTGTDQPTGSPQPPR